MEYRLASKEELEKIWDFNIAENSGDERWVDWKKEYIGYNLNGEAFTFLVLDADVPIGEGTLILSPACDAIAGRLPLCDGKETANINALRIRKEYEGNGHISKLMREIECYAKNHKITRLTIGVEAKETRNLAIYLHLGFTEFLFSEVEEGELVLYLGKTLE
ncbi:MAG: GNAT family N-acetyltransferase [Lachnospiraceae bacterium]|nr:GNAT family N-acetyltransferase [Lachnospiraceae bacterium]